MLLVDWVRGWMLWGLAVEAQCGKGFGEWLDCVLQRVRGVLRDLILGLKELEGWIELDARVDSDG